MEGSSRLRNLLSQVEQMLDGTGAEARGFRDSLRLMKNDLERELAKSLKLYNSSHVDRLASRFSVLEESFRPIAAAIRDAATLHERASALKEASARRLDATVAEYFRTKCDEWIASLDRLLAEVNRLQHLEGPRRTLAEVESALGRYEDALKQLTQAKALVTQLGPVKTAEFQLSLLDLQKRLLDHRLDIDWLSEMKRRLDVLRTIAAEPPPEPAAAPPALEDCQRMLPDADRWSRALGFSLPREFADRLQKAEDSLNAGRPSEIEQLGEDLRGEIARLKKIAAERRTEAQTKLQEDYRYFKECCGETIQSGDMGKLLAMSTDSWRSYRDWKSQFDEAYSYFLSMGATYLDDLAAHLKGQIARLDKRLEAIRCRELSEEVTSETARVAGALMDLHGQAQLEEIMAALRQVTSEAASSLNARISQLESRSAEDWRKYQDQNGLLLERVQVLEMASNEAGIPVSDPRSAAGDDVPGAGLKVFFERLRIFETTLDRETELFQLTCLNHARADLAFCRSARDFLTVVVPGQPDVPEVPQRVEGPKQAASIVTQASGLRMDFAGRIENGAEVLQKAMEIALREVEIWVATPGYLAAEDCDAATSWLADHLKHRESPEGLDLVSLRARSRLLLRYRSLHDRLEKEAQEVSRLKKESVDRLQDFSQEEFGRFFPELSRRVSALVYGVDLRGRQWTWAKLQLDEAQRLLDLLEFQSQRLMAQEVAQGRAALERQIQRTTEQTRLSELTQLASLLRNRPDTEAVPLDLRRRLSDLRLDLGERRSHA